MNKSNGKGSSNMPKSGKKAYRGKSRKSSVDSDRVKDRSEVDSGSRFKINDPSWYAATPQLLSDAASFPYSWPIGASYPLTNANFTSDRYFDTTSGIATIELLTGPGKSTDNYSAVNVAARNIYSFVRHANSGHSNYDAPDLMLYLLAMDNIYSLFSHLQRVYGMVSLFNYQNRYFPKYAIKAMGFDYAEVSANYAQLRYGLNAAAIKIGSMCVPKSMPIMERHRWIFSGLYADGTSAKAQIYAYVPHGYYQYVETEGAGYLKYRGNFTYGGHVETVSTWLGYLNNMIEAVIASEDMNIMSGDILKAYGVDGVYQISAVPDNYTVVPVYSEEVLSQFQNATCWYENANRFTRIVDSYDITQLTGVNEGTIIFNPGWKLTYSNPDILTQIPSQMNRMLSFNLNTVTPSDTMVGSRLTFMTGPFTTSGSDKVIYPLSFGTEIPFNLTIYTSDPGADNDLVANSCGMDWILDTTVAAPVIQANNCMAMVSRLSQFKYHPQVWVMTNGGATSTSDPMQTFYRMFEIDNTTILNAEDLQQLHDTAVLSEFSCPQMGSFNNKVR